jgi:hypothetical protein
MNTLHTMSRGHLLRVGVGSCLSLSLGRYLELQAAESPAAPVAKAKSVIHIFLGGGLGQHESWDPKPEAAAEYRGEFGAVGTKVPGMQLCELLKKTAGVADKLTLLRGVWHTESAHERGQMTMLTGWQPSPAVMYPSMGSIVSHELGARKNLPPFVTIPSTPGAAGDVEAQGFKVSRQANSLWEFTNNSSYDVQDMSNIGVLVLPLVQLLVVLLVAHSCISPKLFFF